MRVKQSNALRQQAPGYSNILSPDIEMRNAVRADAAFANEAANVLG